MSQKRDQNYFEKKGLIQSPPIQMIYQISKSNISQQQQHPQLQNWKDQSIPPLSYFINKNLSKFIQSNHILINKSIKDLPKPNLLSGIVVKNVNSRSEILEQDYISSENIQILAQKALTYEKELEQRQLQIQKLTSDYEKQRMQAFELEQKLVLLNEENLKYRETLQQDKKVIEMSQEQEIVHKQQMISLKSEQDIKEKLLKISSDNKLLNERLLEKEERIQEQIIQIDNLQQQLDGYNRIVSNQAEEKYNNFEREKKILKDEIEKISLEKKDLFSEFQNKVRDLEKENASLRENASQAQNIQGNSVIQLKNQLVSLQEQLQIIEQQKNQLEQQNLQNSRSLSQNHQLIQQDNERLNREKVSMSEQLQSLQTLMRKQQQEIEDLQCERLGIVKENENLVMHLKENNLEYQNLTQIHNNSLKRNDSNLEKILQQHQIDIQYLIENHRIELLQMQEKIVTSEEQKNLILQKIGHLQETLLNTNKQGASQDFQDQILKTYQSLINMITPRDSNSSNSQESNNKQYEVINQTANEENNKLILLLEEKSKENTNLQNLCDSLQEEINILKQQNSIEEPVKRQKRQSQSDNDTTQDNVSPSPLRPQIFEQDQGFRNSMDVSNNMNQLINDMRKQITELEERLNQELENRNYIENENVKLRLSIQRYEMMGGIQMPQFSENQIQSDTQLKREDKSFTQQEDNSDIFEVSRYLQEEVSRLKGLLDGQKHEYEQQISVLKEQINISESFSVSNNNIISPQLRCQKPQNTQEIMDDCIYEEPNEQSQTDSNQHTLPNYLNMNEDEIKLASKQGRSKTQDDIQRSIGESVDNRLCFSFQDQITHLNDQIQRAERNLRECQDKIKQQENLIQEQDSIIEKNNIIIQQFQENLKSSQYEMQNSQHKNRELETSVLNYQMQLQQYVEQMHRNIEQLNQYEQIIKTLEAELSTKNTLLTDNDQVIENLSQQLTHIQQQQQQYQQQFLQSIPTYNDESEKVKKSNKKQEEDEEQKDQIIVELNNQINNLNLELQTINQQKLKLQHENQFIQEQNSAQFNEIASLNEQQKQLLIAIINNQYSNQTIQTFINSEQSQQLFGDELLNEFTQFIQNIQNMEAEISMMKEQFNQLNQNHQSLQEQYENLQKEYTQNDYENKLQIEQLQEENSKLHLQNDEYLLEIQKLNEHVEQFESKILEDRKQIEELEAKASNLLNLEKVQSNIIEQQKKRDQQFQEQFDNQQRTIQQLQEQLQYNNNNQPLMQQNDSQQIADLNQQIQNLEQKLYQSEYNRNQGQELMEETTGLIDNLNNQINNYKNQIEQQQEIIMKQTNKLDEIQKEYQQKFHSQKQAIDAQNKLIQNLQSQVQTKELEINPLQTAVEQIQQILLSKTNELEKCQQLISNLQNQEKSSYEIIKQQEVFLLEFQKIKKQHQQEKEQNQKVIMSLQHSLDKAQKEIAIQDQSNKQAQNKLKEVQKAFENQVQVNNELQNSLNEVRSRDNSQSQIQQFGEKISCSVKLEGKCDGQEDIQIDYRKQYEELKQILEDQNYLDTLNKYAKQEIQLTRELDDAKEQNNKLQQDYDYTCNQIKNLNITIENIKKDFSFKNQRLQEIYESKSKENNEQDILIQQLRDQIKELHSQIEALENKTVLLVTENQRLSLIRMELTKQIDSKVTNLSEQEGEYVKTLEKTLQEYQEQKIELSDQVNLLKQQGKQLEEELINNQNEKQQQSQQLERLQYQLNVGINNLHQKQVYIEKLELQINQLNNANSQNLQQIHNSYHRKISEIRNNTQSNAGNNNLFSDDSKHYSFLNSISFQDVQEIKKDKATKEYQYNCLLVNYEDQKTTIETLNNQKDMLTQEIMLLKELNDQLVHQLNQNNQNSQGKNLSDSSQVQQQISFINTNLDKLQKANDVLIQENEQLRYSCSQANQKLANLIKLANQNQDCICSCRGSNRLQVSVVEGEMEISDLKDYFGQINSTNNGNIALQPSHVNAKKYNLKINQCAQSSSNSPASKDQLNQFQMHENDHIVSSGQRKLEDIQNISGSNSFLSEKKRTSSLMNPKIRNSNQYQEIRRSITDQSMRQHKLGESVERNGSFYINTENQC